MLLRRVGRAFRWPRVPTRLSLRKLGILFIVAAVIKVLLLLDESFMLPIPKTSAAFSQEQLDDAARCKLVSPGPANYSMRDLLLAWPRNKTRGFIFTLVSPHGAANAMHLAANVYANFNRRFNYPFIIFTESPDAAGSVRDQIAQIPHLQAEGGQVFVYDISRYWKPPPYILEKHDNKLDNLIDYSYKSIAKSGCVFPASLGYWLMCRFQSKCLTEIPFVQSFEYLWRIDTDAQLCGQLKFDIFDHMKDNDYWQGYLAEDTWDSCAQGLTDAVHSYVQTYSITPVQGNDSIKDARTWYIYNNFEIFKVQFYLSKEYRHYIDFIDRYGGFFYYRWGDAPVRTQASRLYMPKNKMREFKVGEVFYRHQSFNRC